MNDEQAFFGVMDAHPDDMTTRLVFADWLQERGEDERAAGYRALAAARIVPYYATGGKLWGVLSREYMEALKESSPSTYRDWRSRYPDRYVAGAWIAAVPAPDELGDTEHGVTAELPLFKWQLNEGMFTMFGENYAATNRPSTILDALAVHHAAYLASVSGEALV